MVQAKVCLEAKLVLDVEEAKVCFKGVLAVVDVLPPIACHGGLRGSIVRASAYAELDGERKRQSIYPGSGPRL